MTDEQSIVIVLGTTQDAGLPQLGCNCTNCSRAISNQHFRRLVSSLGIFNPTTGKSYIIDATPNLTEQVGLLNKIKSKFLNKNYYSIKNIAGTNEFELSGIFLTHAHIGHYLGLVHLGKEAFCANKIPIYATSSMIKFLNANSPFNDLIINKNIIPNEIKIDKKCVINQSLSLTPFSVQHRHEHSDTVGFSISGSKKELLYIPDMDVLSQDILDRISEADIAIIDGTFYDKSELGTRKDFQEVSHPTIKDSIQVLGTLTKETRIYYTHFNHTNPVLDSKSEAVNEIKASGLKLVHEGQAFKI